MSAEVILETKGLTKEFPGIIANNNIDLVIHKGEVRAIMGENGAGKSTLCNMLTGIYEPTRGRIFFEGRQVKFNHPQEALAAGIRMVYQERNLIEYLTGAQSICLGLEARKNKFFVDEKAMYRKAADIREEVGANLPLDVPVEELSPAQQQMVEILRAVANEPKLLILDEPTASLGNEEVEILFRVIRKLKAKGVAVVMITHKLDEVFEISDTISIFRNGEHIETIKNGELDRMEAVRLMLGRDVTSQFPPVEDTSTDEMMLEIDNLSDATGKLSRISMNVKKGEVVGIYGLLGSGRTELLEAIYGLNPRRGKIALEGGPVGQNEKPYDMIARGVLFAPEDRRHNSLFRDFFTIRENVSIGYMDKISNRMNFINTKKEKELFRTISSNPSLRVKYTRDTQDIEELSGGNQQKIVLGRWIFNDHLKVMLMDEPTQGIDVGVKYDIYVLIRDLARQGKSVIIVSSELPELTGVCDRLYVLKDGTFKAELSRDEFDNEKVLEMVL